MQIVCRKPYLTDRLRAEFPEDTVSEGWDASAEVVIADPHEFVPVFLDQLPALRLALCSRAGYDKANTEYLLARGIALCNARGLYSVPIAEDIICKILTYTTNAWLYNHQKSSRLYRPTAERSCLSSLTVGFLGCGSIAQQAALRLVPFGCRIVGCKRSPSDGITGFDALYWGADGLSAVLQQSDIVVLATDLNAETRHLLNDDAIRLMKYGAAVINIARGSVVDESALIRALQSGKLSYAGLDVFETEPLPADSPLWTMPQVAITPHASGMCRDNHANLAQMVVENIRNYQNNAPLMNRVF